MSFQDSSDMSLPFETPDRSLGSLSLSATGEQLDDIQVNFDRMYIDSPQPNSLSSGHGAESALANSTLVSNSSNARNNAILGNQLSASPDAAGFDRLALLDEDEITEVLESVDWLRQVPTVLPADFKEDDRSFLDTGLLNVRYNLLNYVTHVINAGSIAAREIDTRTYTRPKKARMARDGAVRTQLKTTMEVCSFQSENGDSSSPLEMSSIEAESAGTSQPYMDFTVNHTGNGVESSQGVELLAPHHMGSSDATSPQRSLNTTMSVSPSRSPKLRSLATYESPNKLNTTISMSPDRASPKLLQLANSGSPNRFNKTFDMSDEAFESPGRGGGTYKSSNRLLNTTMELVSDDNQIGATASPALNLNETFVAENGESPTSERSRRVTRNLSYVIRRDEESPNNNSSPQVSANTSRCDLNSTFSYEQEAERDAQATRSSRNTSMEDLNSRVASQIRSLGCSTITRGRYSDHGARGVGQNLDETRLVARTSSTDTYSVAHSSESPTSSGLSSPMDAQSYDDIQSSTEVVRRSMPNLAVIRNAASIRSNLVFPQAGGGQLRKNHYISDSRLSRLGSGDGRPRLRVRGTEPGSNSSFNQGLSPAENARARVGANTSTPAALNRISSGLGPTSGASRVYSAQTLGSSNTSRASSATTRPQVSSMGNVRATGLAGPRYTGGLRPPRPTTTSATNIQYPTSSGAPTSRPSTAPGIPVSTFRAQSRIPAPGQLRFSRTSQIARPSGGTYSKGTGAAALRGPVDDWRDGCY